MVPELQNQGGETVAETTRESFTSVTPHLVIGALVSGDRDAFSRHRDRGLPGGPRPRRSPHRPAPAPPFTRRAAWRRVLK